VPEVLVLIHDHPQGFFYYTLMVHHRSGELYSIRLPVVQPPSHPTRRMPLGSGLIPGQTPYRYSLAFHHHSRLKKTQKWMPIAGPDVPN